MPPPPPKVLNLLSSSSLPPRAKVSKKRKVDGTLIPQIQAIDLDDFEFDEVILREVIVINTPRTYFDEGVFGQPELKGDLYHHFGNDIEWARVKEARKGEGASNGKVIVDRLIEMSNALRDLCHVLHYCDTEF